MKKILTNTVKQAMRVLPFIFSAASPIAAQFVQTAFASGQPVTPALDALLNESLRASTNLKLSQFDLEDAQNRRSAAIREWYPMLKVFAGVGPIRSSEESVADFENSGTLNAEAQVIQPLFSGGKTAKKIEAWEIGIKEQQIAAQESQGLHTQAFLSSLISIFENKSQIIRLEESLETWQTQLELQTKKHAARNADLQSVFLAKQKVAAVLSGLAAMRYESESLIDAFQRKFAIERHRIDENQIGTLRSEVAARLDSTWLDIMTQETKNSDSRAFPSADRNLLARKRNDALLETGRIDAWSPKVEILAFTKYTDSKNDQLLPSLSSTKNRKIQHGVLLSISAEIGGPGNFADIDDLLLERKRISAEQEHTARACANKWEALVAQAKLAKEALDQQMSAEHTTIELQRIVSELVRTGNADPISSFLVLEERDDATERRILLEKTFHHRVIETMTFQEFGCIAEAMANRGIADAR